MAHYYKILLVGASGKGKTHSADRLDRDTTGFINGENKPFPFAGSFKIHAVPETTDAYLDLLNKASVNPNIDSVFIDSFSHYADCALAEARATKKGYDIFNHFNERVALFHSTLKKVQKHVFVTAHIELIFDEVAGVKERRAKVIGKQWEGMLEKEYTIVLYAINKANPDPTKRPTHHFQLVDINGSAKCPPALFGVDTIEISNDARLVLDKIKEFQKN